MKRREITAQDVEAAQLTVNTGRLHILRQLSSGSDFEVVDTGKAANPTQRSVATSILED